MFRPCIDLHRGRVVQIVGGTLGDDSVAGGEPHVNFVSERDSASYAAQYRDDDLRGGHVIMLGPGNEQAARQALAAWPGGMQIGGGITAATAAAWLDAGASHVIVTSWLFDGSRFQPARLGELVERIGAERIVIDLSCRRRDDAYWVVSERWQTFTDLRVEPATLQALSTSCAEFLVHGVDVEGLTQGVDLDLVALLADASPISTTYAGGATSLADLHHVHESSGGRVDLTIGSALDIFGGHGVTYRECVEFNRAHRR